MNNIISYTELDFDNGFHIRLEHEYFNNTKLHHVRIKRKFVDPSGEPTREEYPDISFHLEEEMMKEFCNFFVRLKQNSIYGHNIGKQQGEE